MRQGAGLLRRLAPACLLVLLLAGCGRGTTPLSDPLPEAQAEGPRVVFTFDPPTEFDLLPGWRSELKSKALAAFAIGCPMIADRRYARACAAIARTPAGDENAARAFLRDNFRPVLLGTDLTSGYFELTVNGSRTPGRGYTIPVLRPPRNEHDFARADIMAGALAGRGLEILYLQSEADLYFLQLQGSGRVIMTDGTLVRLGTAGDNAMPRIPTERLFGEAQIPGHDLSIPGIRAWAAGHVPETNGRLARDQAYVFFRETPELAEQYGPYGAFSLPLLPLRSAAVDTRTTPLGTMLWINSRNLDAAVKLPHLVVAQDTGPLIQGPARVDLFFGWGPEAERFGGHQHAPSQVWALVPK